MRFLLLVTIERYPEIASADSWLSIVWQSIFQPIIFYPKQQL
jgi:hypothetical protein